MKPERKLLLAALRTLYMSRPARPADGAKFSRTVARIEKWLVLRPCDIRRMGGRP